MPSDDEITDEDRERWANELETTPMPDVGQDAGDGLSSGELFEAIGEAVAEWKDVRDE